MAGPARARARGAQAPLACCSARAADREGSGAFDTLRNSTPISSTCRTRRSGGDRPGDVVGPYRLVRELGQRRHGRRLAGRTDRRAREPPCRAEAAAPGLAARGLAERMARERDILATLTHPNIARLYDAGLTADGRPFLAIEYVEGQPIDEYCRDRQLDMRARRQAVRAGRPCRRLRARASWSCIAI